MRQAMDHTWVTLFSHDNYERRYYFAHPTCDETEACSE